MSDHVFIITGGGTGAKVAESFIHLCATGRGPKNVHILMVDTDASNGNVMRTRKTADAYNEMQQYDWNVKTTASSSSWNPLASSEDVEAGLFGTDITLYRLTEPLDTVISGGLNTASTTDDKTRQVLELLYDESEREATCEDGFRARPNLGCLHLSEHLNNVLVHNENAKNFLSALANAATGSSTNVPVMVTASVFGGTGASLIPVVRECVERALDRTQGTMVNKEGLQWNAIKILPHYQPRERKASVDPDRFLLDTASALQFYSKVYRTSDAMYDGVYVIGSDNPGRNQVEAHLGSTAQSNPAYFEEFMAGLAMLDAIGQPSGSEQTQVRVFVPDGNQAQLQWQHLPYANTGVLREQFAYLLHLAAFHLRQGGQEDFSKGLDRMIASMSPGHLKQLGWYSSVIDRWANNHFPQYQQAGKRDRPALVQDGAGAGEWTFGAKRTEVAEYFARLLLWAETTLKGGEVDLLANTKSDYSAIHQAMANVGENDVDVDQEESDTAMVRTLRAALAAMARLHHNDVRLEVDVDVFQLIDSDGCIPLGITTPEVHQALRLNRRNGIPDEYTRTQVA
ncbi:hypothetical protein CRI93_05675 [Longimonas halophila]|uniref:Uncharacterized protein n=1 Tax=Longimonas halophila TaxID=1469170 RepID=A0A2H3NMV3_9BACT|nr:hypothetical protein [Longimonas halophila]PEN07934.1 hypothetical protein CRI93_05675 [Longimonas halophila]